MPKLWYDSSMSLTITAEPEQLLSLLSLMASNDPYANIYGQLQVGEFVVPKIIRVVALSDDCYLLSDQTYIVKNIQISQRGGNLMEMRLQMIKYAGLL